MCTASWRSLENGYRLIFNRDERKERSRARPPEIQTLDQVTCLAPIDTQAGGTWLVVNELGLSVFVLNYYAALKDFPLPNKTASRGELPLKLGQCKGLEEAIDFLKKMDLAAFRPFILGIVDGLGAARSFSWDGFSLLEREMATNFITTSSFNTAAIQSYRENLYNSWNSSRPFLEYHFDESHPDPAFNPLMSRPDAETHCVSAITVEPKEVKFEYFDRANSGFLEPDTLYLKRREID